ncbi:hypothetical protein M8360_26215, partial [Klebsiella pneumoniae]|nr:hypothetical protein [Klebsiella pneumoniae]
MTSLKTSIKTITYLSDIGCLEIQGASLLFTAVVNPQNPFDSGFQQYRNYLIHRLMFNYGLRVGEVQLLMKDCVGPTLPDSRGNIRFILIVQNLPDDVVDPRKQQPSLKTEHSQRQIELTED